MFLSQKNQNRSNRLDKTDTISSTRMTSQQDIHWTPIITPSLKLSPNW